MISDHLDGSCVEFDAMRCDGSKDDEGKGRGGGEQKGTTLLYFE